VVPDATTEPQVRRIYERGASAVFFWPREALILPRALVEMIAMVRVRGRASKPDQALARAVRAHLRLVPEVESGVRVEVKQGIAFLSGETSLLWKKQVAEDGAAAVPGIKSAVAHDLHVARSDVSDRSLASRVRRLLSDTSQVEESTLVVRVERGYLTLAGSVSSRFELNRVVDLLANVRGVRGIDRLAVVSSKQQRRDRAAAKRLRQVVANRFPDEEVSVAFFGSVAELSGQVDRLRRKKEVERVVADQDAVDRVINKIDVAP
jgi:osmotically-inducible protein OsmY